MAALDSLEKSLAEVFEEKAPKLPESWRKFLVTVAPWVSLVVGILTLWSVWALWQWANAANEVSDLLDDYYEAIGGSNLVDDRLTVVLWVALAVAVIQAVLYIAAFSPLRALKKSGWNLLFYVSLVNLVYGLVLMFTDYGSFGNFIGYLIGTAIGLYLLFQIRSHYHGAHVKKTE